MQRSETFEVCVLKAVTADIQPNVLEWIHLKGFELYFYDNHEMSPVGPGKGYSSQLTD